MIPGFGRTGFGRAFYLPRKSHRIPMMITFITISSLYLIITIVGIDHRWEYIYIYIYIYIHILKKTAIVGNMTIVGI